MTRELAVKIAEQRGEVTEWGGEKWYQHTKMRLPWPKPYPTDIRCAMELWDEMDNARLRTNLERSYLSGGYLLQVYSVPWDDEYEGESVNLRGHGETRCLAVCNAYLEWKK